MKSQLIMWFVGSTIMSIFLPNVVVAACLMPIAISMLNAVGNNDASKSTAAANIFLAVAWGSGLGGFGSPLGGGMNLIIINQVQELTGQEFMYTTWVKLMLPILIVLTIVDVIYMCLMKSDMKSLPGAKDYFVEEYRKLGKMSKEETLSLWLFVIPVVLAFTRELWKGIIPAWTASYVFLPFAVLSFCLPGSCNGRLITWKWAQPKISWGLFYTLAGGLALGKVVVSSGSSAMISGSTDTQTEAQGSERGILPYMLLAIIAAAIVTVVIFLVRAMRTPAEDTGTENLDGSSIAPRDTSAAGTANFVGAAKSISQSAGAAERTDKRSVGAVGRGKENGNTRTVLVSDESTRRDSSPRSAIRASSALASLGSSASQAKASAAPAAASARTTAPAAENDVSTISETETEAEDTELLPDIPKLDFEGRTFTPEELQRILLARRRASSAGNARTAQSNGAAQSRQVSASDITVPRRAPSVQPAQTARSGQASRGIQNTTPVQRRSARTAPPSQGQAVRQRQSAQRPPQPEGPFAYHSDRDYGESRIRRDDRRR